MAFKVSIIFEGLFVPLLLTTYNLYRARGLLAEWVTYYNDERLHSALEYLRSVDYYPGNPQALLAERKTKLREAAARRKGGE